MRAGDRRVALRIEAAFALVVVLAFAELMIECVVKGYAVQPFVYDTFDTFMDWFNTAFWAWRPREAFGSWGTVYPPQSFVFLRLTTIQACYIGSPVSARDCDWLGHASLVGSYLLAVICVARLYRKVDRATALFRTAAIALGLPLLFALERGNLIIITLVFVLLGISPLIGSARLRWLSLAVAINFKVYLIAALAGMFAKRKWLALEATVLLIIAVYAANWLILGVGTPMQLVENIQVFAESSLKNSWQDVYYSSTLTSFERLATQTPALLRLLGSTTVEWIALIVPVLVRTTQLACIAAIVAAFLRPASAPAWRVAVLGIGFAITSSEAGGYTHLLVLALVFLEPWRGPGRIVALVCAYLLSIPNDIVLGYLSQADQQSWWANGTVFAQYGVAVGHIVRPVLMLVLLCALSLDTVAASLARAAGGELQPAE